MERQSREANHEFWSGRLSDVKPCLFPLSTKRAERVSTFQVHVQGFNAEDMRSFCAKWETTTAVVIQAAWALVLHRYTGSTLPCFGVLTSGRDVPVDGVHSMLGPLICLIPCRVRLDEPRPALETLRMIQGEYAESLPHQTYALAERSNSPLAEIPELFNTVLSFQRSGEQSPTPDKGHSIRFRGAQDPVEVSQSSGYQEDHRNSD